MRRRPEESWQLPERLRPLAKACGWSEWVESRALTRRTFVRALHNRHESYAELFVDRGPHDREELVTAALATAQRKAGELRAEAERLEGEARKLAERAAAARGQATAIGSELDALARLIEEGRKS